MTPAAALSQRLRGLLRVALVLGLAASGTTAVLGVRGDPSAFSVGALLSAGLALAGGLVLAGAVRRSRAGRTSRAAFAASALVWGTGQGLIGLHALTDPLALQVPTGGDVVATAAAPLAMVGLLTMPRPADGGARRHHLVLDALMIAGAGAAVLWQTSFRVAAHDASSTALAVAVLLADLALLALMLLMGIATLQRGVLVAAAGFGMFALGDLVSTYALVEQGGTWPWQASAAAALGWPLLCAGLRSTPSRVSSCERVNRLEAESRTSSAAAVLVVALAAALAGVAALSGRAFDLVSALLLAVVLALMGSRELVHLRQRLGLVRHLTEQAHHDFLTGLGNRRALVDHLRVLAARGGAASVVVVDLDRFKEVNDRLGHFAGDRLLREVARSVAAVLPTSWQLYRLGGDEFALAGQQDEHAGEGVAHAVLAAVRAAAAAVDGVGSVALSASAGVSRVTQGDGDPLVALSEATTAMQEAKASGREGVEVYAGELAARIRHRALLTERLREGVATGSLDVALQPVVDIASGAVTGFEVLCRWEDAVLGRVGPDEFVPVAEETGLVVALGAAVLRQGLAALVAVGGVERRLRLAVNASPLELRTPGYERSVREALLVSGVPADLLTLEVTEAVFVTTDDPAVTTLQALADLGVSVAVDDFGTGYSSLSYLGRLPVHAVKIDRSLTVGLSQVHTRAVVEALVQMCRALDLVVVAEGVEEQHQALMLADLGVQLGQGWLWSAARGVEELPALLEARGVLGDRRRSHAVDR